MPFFIEDQQDILFKLHGKDSDYAENIQFLHTSLEEFISRKVAPRACVNDRDEIFPQDTFHELGQLGFMSIPFAKEYEGLALPFTYYSAALESLGKADAGLALGVAIHGTATDGIAWYASAESKKRHLADLVTGRKIAAFALTEAGSGSDAQALKTSYRYDAGSHEYILNGNKFWITNGMSADVFFVMARAVDGKISSFVVDKSGKGTFQQNPIKDKMGVRSSNTAELIFQDYRIPAYSLVGEEGSGFKYAMRMLNGGRVTIAAWSTGIAQGAYEKLLKYAHERQLFGKKLADLDNTKRELSEMLMEICASRELAYNAAYYKEHKNLAKYASLAKVKATETAVHVAERAIQLAGGYGFIEESKIERHLRDALLGRIGEGANELLKIVVIPRLIYKEFEQKPLTMSW
jgi:alkylation response protein AidB-like acyl-CoA dehydrogenase